MTSSEAFSAMICRELYGLEEMMGHCGMEMSLSSLLAIQQAYVYVVLIQNRMVRLRSDIHYIMAQKEAKRVLERVTSIVK